MPFAVSTIYRQPEDHLTESYLCLINMLGIIAMSKHTVQHSNLPSATGLVLHSEDVVVPRPPETWSLDDEN
jgi:hypothetical protein